MRTTVEISEALARRVRALMNRRGTTLRALIEEGLRRVVEEGRPDEPFRLRDASVGEGGPAAGPGPSWEAMSRLLYPPPS